MHLCFITGMLFVHVFSILCPPFNASDIRQCRDGGKKDGENHTFNHISVLYTFISSLVIVLNIFVYIFLVFVKHFHLVTCQVYWLIDSMCKCRKHSTLLALQQFYCWVLNYLCFFTTGNRLKSSSLRTQFRQNMSNVLAPLDLSLLQWFGLFRWCRHKSEVSKEFSRCRAFDKTLPVAWEGHGYKFKEFPTDSDGDKMPECPRRAPPPGVAFNLSKSIYHFS